MWRWRSSLRRASRRTYAETPTYRAEAIPYLILDHLPDETASTKSTLVLTEGLIDDGPQAEASTGAP
jgi:hypothetical protein